MCDCGSSSISCVYCVCRTIDKACRELDRERMKMEAQEKSIKMQIKKLAKQGQVDAARIMAKVSCVCENDMLSVYTFVYLSSPMRFASTLTFFFYFLMRGVLRGVGFGACAKSHYSYLPNAHPATERVYAVVHHANKRGHDECHRQHG